MPDPVELHPDDLSVSTLEWLKNEQVDLTDDKIKLFRVEYAGETDILIKVTAAAREVEIRLASDVMLVDNATRLRARDDVDDPDTPGPWQPWVITAGPPSLVFTRYNTAGEATRAALRGWQWPARWPAQFESKLGTSPSTPPRADGVEIFEGRDMRWEPSPLIRKYLGEVRPRPYVDASELARVLEQALRLADRPGVATAAVVDAAESLVRKLRQNAVDELVRSLEGTDGQQTP